jgi:hypothetical protein
MLNKTIDDEPVCVCVYYELWLREISYCLFLTITCEYTISYNNSRHTWNLVVSHQCAAAHRLRNSVHIIIHNWIRLQPRQYVLENKTAVVFCILSWHESPPFLCDAAYEWRNQVENVNIKNHGNVKPNTPIGISGQKWKIAQILNIRGSKWATAL